MAGDIVRALERKARYPAGMAGYFAPIRGFEAYQNGTADSIAGLETPDDLTLVVRLDHVVGALAYRFSFAATAPIPEAADAEHLEGLLAATGPYMIEGSGAIDPTASDDTRASPSGLVLPELKGSALVTPGSLTLVRNPSWDRSTDALRPAFPDIIEITLGGEPQQIAHRVDTGNLDLVFGISSPAGQVARYRSDPDLSGRLFVYPQDNEFAVTMNLAVPPFDDPYVRRAVNLAIDEKELVRMISHPPYGPDGASSGEVATHMAPDALEGGLLATFDPYPHSEPRAEQQMSLSAYDRDGDGRCDARLCRGIPTLVWAFGVVPDQARAIARDLEPLGIRLDLELIDVDTFFDWIVDPAQRIPIGIGWAWGSDVPVGDGWFSSLFDSRGLGENNPNMLGASPSKLRRWGYSVTSVPNIDDRVQACAATVGSAQEADCWAALDRYMMWQIVPWAPILRTTLSQVVSERVVDDSYSFDQFAGEPSLDRLALVSGSGSPGA